MRKVDLVNAATHEPQETRRGTPSQHETDNTAYTRRVTTRRTLPYAGKTWVSSVVPMRASMCCFGDAFGTKQTVWHEGGSARGSVNKWTVFHTRFFFNSEQSKDREGRGCQPASNSTSDVATQ